MSFLAELISAGGLTSQGKRLDAFRKLILLELRAVTQFGSRLQSLIPVVTLRLWNTRLCRNQNHFQSEMSSNGRLRF